MQFLQYAVRTHCFLAELDAELSSDYFEEADDEYGSGSMGEEVGQHYMACWENFRWDEEDITSRDGAVGIRDPMEQHLLDTYG